MFTVVLDANVLWSARERDVLLQFASDGLFRPVWSEPLLNEVHWCERQRLSKAGVEPEVGLARADKLVETMQIAFSDAMQLGWEPLVGSFGLPDPNDEHVLAVALVARASAVVTKNQRDFPKSVVPPHIEVMSPDNFALSTIELDPALALRSLMRCAERTGRNGPERSVDGIVEHLGLKCGWVKASSYLRDINFGRT